MTCVSCSSSVNFLKFGTMSVKTLIHFERAEDHLMKLKCSALLRSEMASFYPKQGRRRMHFFGLNTVFMKSIGVSIVTQIIYI